MASQGDLRVLLALDLLLSAAFASVVLFGAEFVGVAEFTPANLALGTLVVAVLTYLVVLR